MTEEVQFAIVWCNSQSHMLGEHLASRLSWGWRREQERSEMRQQDKALSEDFEVQVYIMLKKQNEW